MAPGAGGEWLPVAALDTLLGRIRAAPQDHPEARTLRVWASNASPDIRYLHASVHVCHRQRATRHQNHRASASQTQTVCGQR